MGILSYSVNTCIFNPPNACLDEITSYVGITMVKVRHTFGEPAIGSNLPLVITGVDILDTGGFERSLYVLRLEVEPIVRGTVFEEVVLTSAMVEDHIHHHLQTLFVCTLG